MGVPCGSSHAAGWNPLAEIKRNFHDVPTFDHHGFAPPASVGGRGSASFVSSPRHTPAPVFPATPHLGSMVASANAFASVAPSARDSSSPTSTVVSQPDSLRIEVKAPLDGKTLGLKVKENVVVEIVDPRALQFGFKVGDRVNAVNGVPVSDLDSFASAVAGSIHQWQSTARPIAFSISRGGATPLERRRRGGGCW